MWTIFQAFIECVIILLLFFMFWLFFFFFLAARHVGYYFPDQGLNTHSLALEAEILTTGQPGKCQGSPLKLTHENIIPVPPAAPMS